MSGMRATLESLPLRWFGPAMVFLSAGLTYVYRHDWLPAPIWLFDFALFAWMAWKHRT